MPQGRSGQVRKISPTPGFDPRTVQAAASRFRESSRYSCQISVKFEIPDRFSKNILISSFVRIRLVEAKLFHVDGRKNGRTDGRRDKMTKLKVSFGNLEHAPRNYLAFGNLEHAPRNYLAFVNLEHAPRNYLAFVNLEHAPRNYLAFVNLEQAPRNYHHLKCSNILWR